jgi:hypothetical protein
MTRQNESPLSKLWGRLGRALLAAVPTVLKRWKEE